MLNKILEEKDEEKDLKSKKANPIIYNESGK